jgi:dsRNA-specific ribonuclease
MFAVPLGEINCFKNQTIATSAVITKPEPFEATISARSMEKSPINVILELCTAKRFPPPIFLLCGIGPSHNPLFIYMCSLLKHQVKGFGPSKKLAKRNAAIKMLEALNCKM